MDKNLSQEADPAAAAAGLLKTFAASILALFVGLAWLLIATERGSAFTTETVRRASVESTPQQVPDLNVVGADGAHTTLRSMLAPGGRIWIVDFVYTRCQTVCSALGSVYQQLQQQIIDGGLQDRIGLLSISFDPDRDGVAALRDHAVRMRMDPGVWQIVTLTAAGDRHRLLDTFGIMVVPAPLGEFEHNAALHIVDDHGRLVRIIDYSTPARALELAQALASVPAR